MVISSSLETLNGKIKTIIDDYDSKKEMVKTYFSVNRFEIPFFNWGNNIESVKFKVIDNDLIDLFLNDLINDIEGKFSLNIVDYQYDIDYTDKSLNIQLILKNGDTLDLVKRL